MKLHVIYSENQLFKDYASEVRKVGELSSASKPLYRLSSLN